VKHAAAGVIDLTSVFLTTLAVFATAFLFGWVTVDSIRGIERDKNEQALREFCAQERNKDTGVCGKFTERERARERREQEFGAPSGQSPSPYPR
jgi:hypothetical protein